MKSERKQKKDLYSLFRNATVSLDHESQKSHGVTPVQMRVLKMFQTTDSIPQKDILHAFGVKAGSLSELLTKMEKENLVTRSRSKESKRESIVSITNKGRIALLEHELFLVNQEEKLFGSLSKEEKDFLARTLKKLNAEWKDPSKKTSGSHSGKQNIADAEVLNEN